MSKWSIIAVGTAAAIYLLSGPLAEAREPDAGDMAPWNSMNESTCNPTDDGIEVMNLLTGYDGVLLGIFAEIISILENPTDFRLIAANLVSISGLFSACESIMSVEDKNEAMQFISATMELLSIRHREVMKSQQEKHEENGGKSA